MMTSSPLRIFSMLGSLQHFWGQGHDLHELFCTQFARDRSEDTGADGLQFSVEQHGGIATELDQRAVFTTNRSEEHTSELQSLMRISYAVFCLKKKSKTTNNTT